MIVLILLADLTTGVFHFLADQYGKKDGRVLTNSVNLLLYHHDDPLKITHQTYWELTHGVYKSGLIIFGISLFFGFSWGLLFFLIVSAQSNIFHKWAHMNSIELHPFVKFLQKFRIILVQSEHSKHHSPPFKGYYCVMTNFWNLIFKTIYFWEFVIWVLKLFGIFPTNTQKNQSN